MREAGGTSADDFEDWVRPHLLAMSRLALRLAGDHADDVVQEALTRAWQRRSTFDPARGEPLPWLLAITADKARRHRARWRVWELHDVEVGHQAEHEARLDLEQAVARLPRKQRLAVELHYFVGLDVATTAATLGCAPGTVKSQLSDARARLHADLEER